MCGRCRTQPLSMACRFPSQRSVPPDARAPLLVSLSASICTWPCARLAQDLGPLPRPGLYGVGSWRGRGICCGLLTAVLVSCCVAASPVECATGPLSTLSTTWLLVSQAVWAASGTGCSCGWACYQLSMTPQPLPSPGSRDGRPADPDTSCWCGELREVRAAPCSDGGRLLGILDQRGASQGT